MAKTAVKVLHKKFRSYSGPVIKGGSEILPPVGTRRIMHVDRAFWLTAKVESGAKLGAIMAADGTGMTIGLDQHIAVYPKELANEDHNAADDQGTLWKLLRRLETVRSSQSYHQALSHLWEMLAAKSWYVAQDGVLRYTASRELGTFAEGFPRSFGKKVIQVKAGDPVFGAHIRGVLTPAHGVVPSSGPGWDLAKEWAKAFHAVTSHLGGEAAQIEYGCEHLVKRTKRRRIKVPNTFGGGARKNPFRWRDLESVGYGGKEVSSLKLGDDWSEELDLALCVYQSHSVNAPGIANKILGQCYQKSPGVGFFARDLIRKLGNSKYGRWDDDIKHGRYQRTRAAARGSGLWNRSLFDGPRALMPRNLSG